MGYTKLLELIKNKYGLDPAGVLENHGDEVYLEAAPADFGRFCLALHQELRSPVMSYFARDLGDRFRIYCAFIGTKQRKWFFVTRDISRSEPRFDSIAKEIYSANLFEREMAEMFGLEPVGNPDLRCLRLHDEVWPQGKYPLRKDFDPARALELSQVKDNIGDYAFARVEGEGVFEVPVGPVHAGIIGPGHFRFSVAGEPIINLEIRLGFTHRGVEKLMEGKTPAEAVKLAECVSGDSSVAHSWSFCQAVEKIAGLAVPKRALQVRAILLELERMYNHANDLGGLALDVGFSQPAALASIIKESIQDLNQKVTASRFLKGVLVPGGVTKDISQTDKQLILDSLALIAKDVKDLRETLQASVSFLDRVETTGLLTKKTAEDLGVIGLAGRASGIALDLREDFSDIYNGLDFKMAISPVGDVRARLVLRFEEFAGSLKIIEQLLDKLSTSGIMSQDDPISRLREGFALGYIEGWRGPVLYWIDLDKAGRIERCKIVDPSFHNWPGLSYAALENIVPDFPLMNKSFDLSYSGNDL